MGDASKENGAPAPVAQNAPEEVQNQNAEQRPPTKLESFLSVTKSLVIRALIIYFISTFFRGQKPPADPKSNNAQVASVAARNIFNDGQELSLHVYLSPKDFLTNYSEENLFWYLDGIVYGDWEAGPNRDGTFYVEKDVEVTEGIKNNGSLYLHAFMTKSGYSPDPDAKNYARNQITAAVKQLNRFKMMQSAGTKNLLTGETEKDELHDGKIVSYWHPNLTLNLVTDQKQWTYGAVPAPVDTLIKFTSDGRFYKPVLFANDFWNMAKDYKPLNESLTLHLTFQPLSLFKWELYVAQEMRNSMFNFWGEDQHQAEDQDTLKQTLLDTNPYLLGITVAVSLLHSVFELLAFKNDIQFWNNRNSLEGLSVRSVFFSVFQSLIVLLYVLDNETNTLIRISCFVGLCIELWKIKKVVDIKFVNGRLVFEDKSSYVESSTREYDKLAFKYLSWVCFPLLAGYSIYALLYLEHKGWYSFVLDIFYGYLLTFGFIMMTPQLFINYKLKSVAHLPWRMLTYKFLNTFIDDMFAFVIKMPTMYRIGCFRDDIVFLIFVYQKWIYPVDKKRRNEFGFSGEQEENQKSIKEGGNQIEAKETKKSQ